MTTADNRRRLDRITEVLDDDDASELLPVMVMTDEAGLTDPRLDALVAQARAEGRMVVTPWEETETGELVDTSSAAYRADQPPHVIQLPRRDTPPR